MQCPRRKQLLRTHIGAQRGKSTQKIELLEVQRRFAGGGGALQGLEISAQSGRLEHGGAQLAVALHQPHGQVGGQRPQALPGPLRHCGPMGRALAQHTGLAAADGLGHGNCLRAQWLPRAFMVCHHSTLAMRRCIPRNQGSGTWRHSGARDDNGMRPRTTTP
ncbi:hypothetical protein D3C71_1668620 [compost metagenome]